MDLSILVSAVALAVALASLWAGKLSPFHLVVLSSCPTFKVYQIGRSVSGTKDGKTWWIPSLDMSLSLYNTGRRPGVVRDVRVVMDVTEELGGTQRHIFEPIWLVDFARFDPIRHERFKWIDQAVVGDWYGILLQERGDREIHIVLETHRWEHKFGGQADVSLEVLVNRAKTWQRVRTYKLHLEEEMFGSGSSWQVGDEEMLRNRVLPPDEKARGKGA